MHRPTRTLSAFVAVLLVCLAAWVATTSTSWPGSSPEAVRPPTRAVTTTTTVPPTEPPVTTQPPVEDAVAAAEPTVTTPAAPPPSPPHAAPTGTSESNVALGHQLAAQWGWPDDQFNCLVDLWNHESGWRTDAGSPEGAYGIPQSFPGSKMATIGDDWRTNPATQIEWGAGYVVAAYGSACNAWATWLSRADANGRGGWY